MKGGIRATVKVAGFQRECRFSPGTPARVVASWKARERAKLQKRHPQPERGMRHTLARDAETYYSLIRHLSDWTARRAEIRAWLAALGDVYRHTVERGDVLRVRGQWMEAGVAPKTCNNRVSALRHLFHQLDGDDAPTPCDRIRPLGVHKTPPQMVAASTIIAVVAELERREAAGKLRDGRTRARFMVLASTGKRPSELMRTQPGDVDLRRRVWIARDGKGGFSPGVFLNDDMLAAWRIFIDERAWGDFNTHAFATTLRAAGWPADVRPYQLRHSVGMQLSDGGSDLADIQQHLGHKRIETTRRHYVPVLNSRLQTLSEQLNGRFGWQDRLAGTIKSA